MKLKDVNITYIGGGSRNWARTFMGDLAYQADFGGHVRLYDIDIFAAEQNKIIGEKMQRATNCHSKWSFSVSKTLEEALSGTEFVIISILPGTFKEMISDVHVPEEYKIYQSVGDTAGPGGIFRAMRTVPIFETFAKAVKQYCPSAFVLNLTNPMTLCTKTLFDVFPEINAFGCCHEVFSTQKFLAKIVEDETGEVNLSRYDIKTDVVGVNHFTWFTKAEFNGQDIYPIYKKYVDAHYADTCFEDLDKDPFYNSNRVKMDLFRRYGQIAAAGDRHLAEFVSGSWYLDNPKIIREWSFSLTPVSWRVEYMNHQLRKTEAMVEGIDEVTVSQSEEELVKLISALLGLGDFVSNVNMANRGQADFAPVGAIVESNAVFAKNKISPILSAPLFSETSALVKRVVLQQESLYLAIKERNLSKVFNVFMSDPLCGKLSLSDGKTLFNRMFENTKHYLGSWNV